jgi:hypothetical protein
VFITLGAADFRLIWNGSLHRWSPEGYVDPIAITDADIETAVVVMPSLSVAALRQGYPLEVHPSAATEERTSLLDPSDSRTGTVSRVKTSTD